MGLASTSSQLGDDGENDEDDCDKDDDYNNYSRKVTMDRMLTCTPLFCKAVTHMLATLGWCWTWCLPAPSTLLCYLVGQLTNLLPPLLQRLHPEGELAHRPHRCRLPTTLRLSLKIVFTMVNTVLWLKRALSMLFMIFINLTRCWVTAILHSTRSSSQLWKC